MNKIFLHFYSSMNDCKVTNQLDSLYWIYSVENIISKQDGVSHRYLKVRFFNRNFNENDNLMQMKLEFHGMEIIVNKFEQVYDFHNPNVLGFLYEIDLVDNSEEISIKSYIVDGHEVIPNGNKIDNLEICNDEFKVHIIEDYILSNQKNVNLYPSTNDDYWGCCCGYINDNKDNVCHLCGRTLDGIMHILSLNLEMIVLKGIAKHFTVDVNQELQKQVDAFVTNCANKYGINTKNILANLQLDDLKDRYLQACNEKIEQYMKEHLVQFDEKKSFESNVETYINGITQIEDQKQIALHKIDLESWKDDYDTYVKNKQIQCEQTKKRNIIIIGSVVVLVILLIVFSIFMNPQKNEAKPKEQTIVKEEKKDIPEKIPDLSNVKIYAGLYASYAVDKNNYVHVTQLTTSEYNNGQADVQNWSDIDQLATDQYHTIGLRKNGTVVSTELYDEKYDSGQTDVDDWKDIVQVSASTYNTVGLQSDGTVVCTNITNEAYDFGQSDVEHWTDIVQVVAAWDHTIGLKSDGTLVSTSINTKGYDYGETNIGEWTDIVEISSAANHTLGLKKDGTVVAVGLSEDGRCDVSSWENIISISTSRHNSLGLKKDGTVVSSSIKIKNDVGQSNVSTWKDIIKISAGWNHSIGLKKDGSIVSTSITDDTMNTGQEDIYDWDFH